MIRYSSTAIIHRPPRAVYELLLDPRRSGEWTDMVDVTYDDTEPKVGARGRFRLARGPLKGWLSSEITELEPEQAITWHIEHPTLRWNAHARLRPTGDGTELEYSGELSLRGWRRLLEPLMAAEVKAGEGMEVERLKALLEAESPASVAATA